MNTEITLDDIIHQPIRTKVIALLIKEECDYNTIKKTLGLTDGHMTTHMRKLIGSKYVEMEKKFVKNKPKTTYKITKLGKEKFQEYLNNLRSILESK